MAWCARELVHDRGPAAVLDSGDGEGVDCFQLALSPLCGRCVNLITLANSADLGIGAFFLLQQHAPALEVSNLRHHGTLHDGAALVVLDVAHPSRLLKRDLLSKALFLEIANSVVVGVGEEVHDLGSGFDVVFEVGHEMRAVALDLLVRRDGTEDDFGELALVEGAVRNATTQIYQSCGCSCYTKSTYPTTSSGCLTMAMLKCVRS